MYKKYLLVALTATLLACSNAEERKTAYLDKANALQAQGDYAKARLELKNALQIDPKDAKVWYQLGGVEEKLQNWRGAAGIYLRVLETNPDHSGAKLKLAKLYLLGDARDKGAALIEEVLKVEPANVDALVLRAALAARANDIASAERDVMAVLEKDPHNVEASILSASLATRAGKPDEAIRLLTAAVAQHPKHAGLRSVLADVYAKQGRVDDGAAQLQEVIAQEPQNAAYRVHLAEYYLAAQRSADAERTLREGLQQQTDKKDLQLALVNLLVAERKPEQAVTTLAGFIKESPADYSLRFRLAEFYQALGQRDKARGEYQAIITAADKKPDGLKARTQLARLLIADGDAERAADLVKEVLKVNARDNDALQLHAGIALANQDPTTAIADLRSVLRDQPASVPVLRELARAHALNGDMDLAIETLHKASDAAPKDAGVRVALAGLLAQRGQQAQAREQIDLALKDNPNNKDALDTLFKMELAKQDYAAATKVAQRIQAQQGGLGEYYAGLVLQAQKKYGESIARFDAALKQVPGASEPLSALVKSRLAQGEPALAEQRLREELTRTKDNIIAYNLLGEVLALQKKYDVAITALGEAQRINPRIAMTYRNLAAAQAAKGDKAAAVAVLQQGASETGQDPSLVFMLASYQENQGQPDQAIAIYEKAMKARPHEPLFVNNLAMLLANYRSDQADIDRAVELGERLKGRDNPAYLDTLGWAYYRRGDVAAAMPLLEAAARKVPDSPLLNYHLGMAYYQKGDHKVAKQYLERAVTNKTVYHGADEAKATLAKLSSS